MTLIRPPRLHPGASVRVVAPAGPVDRERFTAGVEALGGRYDLRYDEDTLFSRTGFFAGHDAQRLEALNAAIQDSECGAIIMARGGYGLTRILSGIDPATLRANPKVIVGYSDVSALLAVCFQAGLAAIHGPMLSEYGALSEEDRAALFRLLESPEPSELLSDLEPLVEGSARGPLVGGNLEVLSRLLGTPHQPDFEGAVLILEDLGELPYRVDRLLTHLESAGVFASVAAVVLGDFTDCDELEGGKLVEPTTRAVLEERLSRLRVPVALGGAFGHGSRKSSLPIGVPVVLDTGRGTLTSVHGAVS